MEHHDDDRTQTHVVLNQGTIISQYRIVEKIGAGGMGEVYLAEDTNLNRQVALKFLPSLLSQDPDVRARFTREAQSAAKLDHPNIVTIYDVGEFHGRPFFAMQYVEGKTLHHYCHDEPLPIDKVIALACQICEGLAKAHAEGIIHRDIKSANIVVDSDMRPKILDFGLAVVKGGDKLTKAGTTVGTVAYMSPEQAKGREVDHRSDLYSLGAVLYELIAGRTPFRRDNEAATLQAIVSDDPEPLARYRANVPVELQRIVTKCLAKEPGERYQSMTEMAVDLRRAAKELGGANEVLSAKSDSISLWRHMLDRRVPQVVGIYLIASVGVLLFLQWLVDNYPVSPHLPEFSLGLLVSMIPTVVLVAYFQGRPDRERWTPLVKIGIPANIVVAAALLLYFFQGSDLGAATTTVLATDDQGQVSERVIPKVEFRKQIGLFYFENDSDDDELDWLSYGLACLLWFEFKQDIYVESYYGFADELEEAGFESPIGAPLTLQRKLATDKRQNYFATGSFTHKDGSYVVKISLYETASGKLISQHSMNNNSVFIIADSLSVYLRREMEVPTYHIEQTPDLPVSAIVTESEEAYKHYCIAWRSMESQNDYEAAREHLEAAISLDPTFAAALKDISDVYSGLSMESESKRALSDAMNHRYRLPEPMQFELRINYQVNINEDMESAISVMKQWASIYPQSLDAHGWLAMAFEFTGELDSAIAENETILALDPERKNYLQSISRLYEVKGDIQAAIEYSLKYAELFPDRFESFTHLSTLYANMGDLEQARVQLKKALTIEPDNVLALTNLAVIEAKLGNEVEMLAAYEQSVRAANSVQDSMSTYRSMADHYRTVGQMELALDKVEKYLELAMKDVPPAFAPMTRAMEAANYYAEAGQEEKALDVLGRADALAFHPMMKGVVADYYMDTYQLIDDPKYLEDARKKWTILQESIEDLGADEHRWREARATGLVAHFEGDHKQAALHYDHAIELMPQNLSSTIRNVRLFAGRCHRESGNLVAAQDQFTKALMFNPYHPKPNYGQALVLSEMGKYTEALKHLNLALSRWKDADPGYQPAAMARATRDEWEKAGHFAP